MAVMNEDFHRCECGNAEYEVKEVVTLPAGMARKRYEFERDMQIMIMSKAYYYICTKCGKHFD